MIWRILSFFCVLNVIGSHANATPAGKGMNYIIIHVDDLGWADLGCYGSTFYETPHIDTLAAGGMRFTHGYAACAVCSPTRAALLTGRYPARIGITDWIRARFQGGAIPEDKQHPNDYVAIHKKALRTPRNPLWMEHSEWTIAEALKSQDYVTCHIGKWHLGTDDWYPDTQGFDYNFGGCDFGQPPSYFDPYISKRKDGSVLNIPTLSGRRKGEYLTDREADEAVSFIRRHAEDPFFLYLAPYAVHTPIQAKKSVSAKYANKRAGVQSSADYAAMVESVDDMVGQVTSILKELELTENTVVIFTSDNGGLKVPRATNNVPLRSGKGYPYEGGIRVPAIVIWPGLTRAGSVSQAPVCSIDYLPTIVAAEGIDVSEGTVIDGRDIRPLLGERVDVWRQTLIWHFPHYRGNLGPYSILREDMWKLIKHYDRPVDQALELYHLGRDPAEQHDLASDQIAKAVSMDLELKRRLKSMGARLPK